MREVERKGEGEIKGEREERGREREGEGERLRGRRIKKGARRSTSGSHISLKCHGLLAGFVTGRRG